MDNKITVIIPVYNESKTIFDILNKVQEYCDEIIVINDGSTDESLDIINSFLPSSKTLIKY